MRTTWLASIGVAVLAAAQPAIAQVNEKFADLNDEIEMLRSMAQTERKALIAEGMQLSPAESQAFWPVYNDYRAELVKVGDRRVKLITDYAASYETLTDEQAKTLLKQSFDIQDETVRIRKKYLKRFEKVLPVIKVARFYQLENKIDAVVNLQLAQQIPLVR